MRALQNTRGPANRPSEVVEGILFLEGDPQAQFDFPWVAELAIQHAKTGRALEIQSAGAVLAWIVELHMVERVEELRVEGGPNAFGDFCRLCDRKVEVPAMLAVKGPEIVGSAVNAQDCWPKHVVHGRGVSEKVYAGAADLRGST